MIHFEVEGKVPAKANKYKLCRGRIYKEAEVVNYERSFEFQTAKVQKGFFPDRARLQVVYQFFVGHDCDADNMEKTVNDCMQKTGIIANDNKIDYHTCRKVKGSDRPRVVITISEDKEQ